MYGQEIKSSGRYGSFRNRGHPSWEHFKIVALSLDNHSVAEVLTARQKFDLVVEAARNSRIFGNPKPQK